MSSMDLLYREEKGMEIEESSRLMINTIVAATDATCASRDQFERLYHVEPGFSDETLQRGVGRLADILMSDAEARQIKLRAFEELGRADVMRRWDFLVEWAKKRLNQRDPIVGAVCFAVHVAHLDRCAMMGYENPYVVDAPLVKPSLQVVHALPAVYGSFFHKKVILKEYVRVFGEEYKSSYETYKEKYAQ